LQIYVVIAVLLLLLQKGEAVAAAAAEQSQRKAAAEGAKERRGVLFYKVTVKVWGWAAGRMVHKVAVNVGCHVSSVGYCSGMCAAGGG
jgi:hypothetical protein